MGSFQQVLMGATCLAAAFLFGSYLHNRPAENNQVNESQTAAADPLDTFFSFGKKDDVQKSVNQAPVARLQESPPVKAKPAARDLPSIDPAEIVPRASTERTEVGPTDSVAKAQGRKAQDRKPVVPDFSELASRFRNTPLELNSAEPIVTGVHQSERIPQAGTFTAPEMVLRKPEDAKPIQEFSNQIDRIEESIRGEFSSVKPEAGRWRVNRSEEIDRFRQAGQAPEPDAVSQETIDDVLSRRSSDYLRDESERETWATNPTQDSWTSERQRAVTAQAAKRNRDLLDIEDPGNRFRSDTAQFQEMAPPEPDFDETDYYTPSPVRQDSVTYRSGLQPIRMQGSNWSRQSNMQSQFDGSYRIQPGDTLQSISTRFYGSAEHYLEIYKANRTVLDRITSSPAGIEIQIPDLNN